MVLVGHGSRRAGFEVALKKVARAFQKKSPRARVLCAYLEINTPSIHQAIDACVADGARQVKVLPYFLLTGNHVRDDIPRIVGKARRKYRGRARILLCPYLGFHNKIVDVVTQRLREAR